MQPQCKIQTIGNTFARDSFFSVEPMREYKREHKQNIASLVCFNNTKYYIRIEFKDKTLAGATVEMNICVWVFATNGDLFHIFIGYSVPFMLLLEIHLYECVFMFMFSILFISHFFSVVPLHVRCTQRVCFLVCAFRLYLNLEWKRMQQQAIWSWAESQRCAHCVHAIQTNVVHVQCTFYTQWTMRSHIETRRPTLPMSHIRVYRLWL